MMGPNMTNKQLVLWSNNIFSYRLPNRASIFSAGIKALQMALRFIHISQKKDFIIVVDSKSVLEAFENMKLDNPGIFGLTYIMK